MKLLMAHTKELSCENCGNLFQREAREAARSERLGRRSYCSRICSGQQAEKNLPPYTSATTYPIAKHAGNLRDEYTGFREHLRRCRRRGHEVTVLLDDLLAQWNTQKGICPYTGLRLQQPSYQTRNDVMRTASLDRIDSRRGYVAGNIQFVSMAMNFAKSTLSHEQTIELCQTITQHWRNGTE